MSPDQYNDGADRHDRREGLIHVDAKHPGGVQPQKVKGKTDDRIDYEIDVENIALFESVRVPPDEPKK